MWPRGKDRREKGGERNHRSHSLDPVMPFGELYSFDRSICLLMVLRFLHTSIHHKDRAHGNKYSAHNQVLIRIRKRNIFSSSRTPIYLIPSEPAKKNNLHFHFHIAPRPLCEVQIDSFHTRTCFQWRLEHSLDRGAWPYAHWRKRSRMPPSFLDMRACNEQNIAIQCQQGKESPVGKHWARTVNPRRTQETSRDKKSSQIFLTFNYPLQPLPHFMSMEDEGKRGAKRQEKQKSSLRRRRLSCLRGPLLRLRAPFSLR